MKVTAFGPVVNLASRLEGLTKLFGAKVIVDEKTALALQASGEDGFKMRKLARVRPAGMEKEIVAWEMLVPQENEMNVLSHELISTYEASVDAMTGGDWQRAYDLLHSMPSWD